jgi:site-specific DNA recombinase
MTDAQARPMIASIYARKSTEQTGVADDQKSVARQIEHARQYATRKGWLLADDHVYVDDGISGAEFAGRPGFVRLMNALKPRAPFQVLVMSEESRLGRESTETTHALKRILSAGVRVFVYLDDREVELGTFAQNTMAFLRAEFAAEEHRKASQRTYDGLCRKAKAGHVTGGRVFGYDNVEIVGANGQRSHVERRINDAEAAVVRQIFERSAAGAGLTRIAKELNAAGALTPRPHQGRPAGWAPSSVREVLLRALYRGEIVWNQTKKRDTWGSAQRSERPEESWLRVPAPELRIVSADLWSASQRERSKREAQYSMGERSYRASSYLLSGFARCAVCGGGFASHSRAHGKRRVMFYACTAHWKRGPETCRNGLVGRMDAIDAEVLATLETDVLRPRIVEAAIAMALDALRSERRDDACETLTQDLAAARVESERLADAIQRGGPMDVLLDRLRACQKRRAELEEQIAATRPIVTPVTGPGLEQRLRAKLADWRGLLTRNIDSGRDVLRALLVGPLRFTPIVEDRRRAYAFEGAVALERLVSGVIDLPTLTGVASPGGYGRLWAGDVQRRILLAA